MPKKEKVWMMGYKGSIGPWVWQVWTKGSKKPTRIIAFDLQHIKDQLEGKQVTEAVKQSEEKEQSSYMPLGPKGATVNRPADYDAGFKILRQWIDDNGGPPESIRKQLRELYIDYEKGKK